jgi:hypothetical protein
MQDSVPNDHPLRVLFCKALKRAFLRFEKLYSPDVEEHLQDHVLTEFIHVDQIYRLKDGKGRRLEDLPEMVSISGRNEGPERRIEVDRYIGDFVVFMGGFFPNMVTQRGWFVPRDMVSRIGKIHVQFRKPLDYYVAEGRNAYCRAAKTAELFDPISHRTYRQLGTHIEGYVDVVKTVRELIADDPQVRAIEEAAE